MGSDDKIKKDKIIIEREAAEADFYRFTEAMDLDVDVSDMDAEDTADFDKQKMVVVKAIERGKVKINEKGEPVFCPSVTEGVTEIIFREPTGGSYLAMDRKKKNYDITKTFSVMSDMTRVPILIYSKMPKRDLKICQAIFVIFMG